ncbi:MAG TPA: hypothetical protein VF549_15715 [Solirubrobacteraceae bacterium]
MPRRTSRLAAALVALAAALALPSTAPAAISLGQTTNAGTDCDADSTLAQSGSAAPGYTVAFAGVITELRTENLTGEDTKLQVFRPRGNRSWTVLATAKPEPATGVIKMPVRVAVQPGDVLGLSTGAAPSPHPNCAVTGSGTSGADPHDVIEFRSGAAPDSGDVTLDNADLRRLNVAATLEGDNDGDGFGDETQDACPDDPTKTGQQPCSADVVVSQIAVETDVERDDVDVLTIFVRNNGSSVARNVRVTEPMPPGVQLVATTPSAGGCAGGPPLDCTIPSLAPGGTASVFVVVKLVSTGGKTLTATAASPTPDPNGANNSATVEFDVSARRSVVAPGTFCRVPKLSGLSRTAARRALEAAGCRLGRTSRRRFRSGRFSRVRLQSIPAHVRVAAGTKVSITLRKR